MLKLPEEIDPAADLVIDRIPFDDRPVACSDRPVGCLLEPKKTMLKLPKELDMPAMKDHQMFDRPRIVQLQNELQDKFKALKVIFYQIILLITSAASSTNLGSILIFASCVIRRPPVFCKLSLFIIANGNSNYVYTAVVNSCLASELADYRSGRNSVQIGDHNKLKGKVGNSNPQRDESEGTYVPGERENTCDHGLSIRSPISLTRTHTQ